LSESFLLRYINENMTAVTGSVSGRRDYFLLLYCECCHIS